MRIPHFAFPVIFITLSLSSYIGRQVNDNRRYIDRRKDSTSQHDQKDGCRPAGTRLPGCGFSSYKEKQENAQKTACCKAKTQSKAGRYKGKRYRTAALWQPYRHKVPIYLKNLRFFPVYLRGKPAVVGDGKKHKLPVFPICPRCYTVCTDLYCTRLRILEHMVKNLLFKAIYAKGGTANAFLKFNFHLHRFVFKRTQA